MCYYKYVCCLCIFRSHVGSNHTACCLSLPGPGYFDCTIKRLFSPYGATPQPGSLQRLWVIIIMSAESADNQAISPPASIVLLYTLPKKIQPNPPTQTRYRMEGVVTRHLGKRVAGVCEGPHAYVPRCTWGLFSVKYGTCHQGQVEMLKKVSSLKLRFTWGFVQKGGKKRCVK